MSSKWNKLGSKRGVDTLMRTTYRTQVDLTGIADSKANIMISINGIILSIILATVVPTLTQQPWLVIPTAVLLVTSIGTLIFAVLSAIPRVNRQKVTLDQVREGTASILFFGHFTHMTRDDFEAGMEEVLHDREMVYGNMVRDIYNAGTVLERKYALIRISYLFFIIGIVLSFLLFVGFYIAVPITP